MKVLKKHLFALLLTALILCPACAVTAPVETIVPEITAGENKISESENIVGSPQSTKTNIVEQNNLFIAVDGAKQPIPELLAEGKYLCESKNGEIYYSKLRLPDSSGDVEKILKEEVWVKNGETEKRILENYDFYGIEDASLSRDGRYLALLDAGLDNKLLQVADLQEGKLHNLGEEGLGAHTASFIWDENESVIYTFSGYNSLQLLKYDFSKPSEESVSSVEELPGFDSALGLSSGKLYFCDSAVGVSGEVYGLDLAEPKRVVIGEGVGFKISPDGKCAALLQSNALDEMTLAYNLSVKDLVSDKLKENIAENVETFDFNSDSQTLYYTTLYDEGVTEEYPFALKEYNLNTGETQLLGFLKTSAFEAAQKPDVLYIYDFSVQSKSNGYRTFIYNI